MSTILGSANSVLSLAWAVLRDDLLPIAPYTGIESFDSEKSASIPNEPIEEGAFASYNNILAPEKVNLTLLFNGEYATQVLALAMLQKFMEDAQTCTIFSPTRIFRNMALERFNYSRTYNRGAYLLACECSFTEIRSVTLTSQTYTPENTTSSNKVNSGQVSTKATSTTTSGKGSMLDHAFGSKL